MKNYLSNKMVALTRSKILVHRMRITDMIKKDTLDFPVSVGPDFISYFIFVGRRRKRRGWGWAGWDFAAANLTSGNIAENKTWDK
jgi:hypothetical protein